MRFKRYPLYRAQGEMGAARHRLEPKQKIHALQPGAWKGRHLSAGEVCPAWQTADSLAQDCASPVSTCHPTYMWRGGEQSKNKYASFSVSVSVDRIPTFRKVRKYPSKAMVE